MKSSREDITVTKQELLLAKIQQMTEADFTIQVVIPIFKQLGFKVDYHGGPGEGGKDVICWKEGHFGELELAVIQVKKTQASAAAGKTNSFSGIITQLQQALEKSVPNLSGTSQRPNSAYFITPFPIDTRALESRFEGLQGITLRGAKVLDGRNVIKYILEKLPEIADSLCGEAYVMKEKLLSNISNADLLSALNYSGEKNISDFYCDLDFGVGRVTTKQFFSMDFAPKDLTCSIPSNRWPSIETLANEIEKLLELKIFEPDITKVKEQYKIELEKWKSPENQAIIKSIAEMSEEIEDILLSKIKECERIITEKLSADITFKENKSHVKKASRVTLSEQDTLRLKVLQGDNISLMNAFDKWRGRPLLTKETLDQIGEVIESASIHLGEIRSETKLFGAATVSLVATLLKDINPTRKIYEKLCENFSEKTFEPSYELTVKGIDLVSALLVQKTWVSNGITKLTEKSWNKNEIRHYFLRCQKLFEVLGKVLDEKIFFDAAGADSINKFSLPVTSRRISMPIREVFDTGIHCAIYGDAGAGKSTTLHKYASFASAKDLEDELTLFLPLTRILAKVIQYGDDETLTPLSKLERGLANFLAAGKVKNVQEIINFIRDKRRVTFIFDGVDEVVKSAPWIIEAIGAVEIEYKNSQIILSSRTSGSYVDSIKYLGLTLLPFTDYQVSSFIDGWFRKDENAAMKVKEHLKKTPELSEIVRSPLLATILCVLAENKVPLPAGELSMYGERLKLLLGHYDIHKKTRRLVSHHSLLENTARKLAFFLHSKNMRSASPNFLKDAAITLLSKKNE